MAMGQNLWYHIWVDEHPFTSYFDVHQGYRVLTHNHMFVDEHLVLIQSLWIPLTGLQSQTRKSLQGAVSAEEKLQERIQSQQTKDH